MSLPSCNRNSRWFPSDCANTHQWNSIYVCDGNLWPRYFCGVHSCTNKSTCSFSIHTVERHNDAHTTLLRILKKMTDTQHSNAKPFQNEYVSMRFVFPLNLPNRQKNETPPKKTTPSSSYDSMWQLICRIKSWRIQFVNACSLSWTNRIKRKM